MVRYQLTNSASIGRLKLQYRAARHLRHTPALLHLDVELP